MPQTSSKVRGNSEHVPETSSSVRGDLGDTLQTSFHHVTIVGQCASDSEYTPQRPRKVDPNSEEVSPTSDNGRQDSENISSNVGGDSENVPKTLHVLQIGHHLAIPSHCTPSSV